MLGLILGRVVIVVMIVLTLIFEKVKALHKPVELFEDHIGLLIDLEQELVEIRIRDFTFGCFHLFDLIRHAHADNDLVFPCGQ